MVTASLDTAYYIKPLGHHLYLLSKTCRISCVRLLHRLEKVLSTMYYSKIGHEYFYHLVRKDYLEKVDDIFQRHEKTPEYVYARQLMIGQVRYLIKDIVSQTKSFELRERPKLLYRHRDVAKASITAMFDEMSWFIQSQYSKIKTAVFNSESEMRLFKHNRRP